MLREETVFGPIKSRRLGNSLGINLLPQKGKFCNFDCIYCECGWNKDGLDDKVLPTAAEVRSKLEDKLTQLLLDGTPIDSITFSGDGEPTLNPEFPRIIDDTLKLRDAFCPGAKVSVLSNATRAHVPEIRAALMKVDNPIMKIDAPTDELVGLINHPAPGYSLQRVIEALEKFEGNFILQTMFLRANGFDSSEPASLRKWMDIVRHLHPREVMVYTIDRPTPEEGLLPFTQAELTALVQPLVDEGFKIQVRGTKK
ncbi:MAG: radical SAM protein [Bacteroidales bacterium]|nr:radical SAM protein [Bacteroidales bacterium]